MHNCNLYNSYLEDGTVTAEQKAPYNMHQQPKQRAREEKEKDKRLDNSHTNIHVACFDLQSDYSPHVLFLV